LEAAAPYQPSTRTFIGDDGKVLCNAPPQNSASAAFSRLMREKLDVVGWQYREYKHDSSIEANQPIFPSQYFSDPPELRQWQIVPAGVYAVTVAEQKAANKYWPHIRLLSRPAATRLLRAFLRLACAEYAAVQRRALDHRAVAPPLGDPVQSILVIPPLNWPSKVRSDARLNCPPMTTSALDDTLNLMQMEPVGGSTGSPRPPSLGSVLRGVEMIHTANGDSIVPNEPSEHLARWNGTNGETDYRSALIVAGRAFLRAWWIAPYESTHKPALMESVRVPAMMHALLNLPAEFGVDVNALANGSDVSINGEIYPVFYRCAGYKSYATGVEWSSTLDIVIRVAERMSWEALNRPIAAKFPEYEESAQIPTYTEPEMYDPPFAFALRLRSWVGQPICPREFTSMNTSMVLALLHPRVARADGSGFDPELAHYPPDRRTAHDRRADSIISRESFSAAVRPVGGRSVPVAPGTGAMEALVATDTDRRTRTIECTECGAWFVVETERQRELFSAHLVRHVKAEKAVRGRTPSQVFAGLEAQLRTIAAECRSQVPEHVERDLKSIWTALDAAIKRRVAYRLHVATALPAALTLTIPVAALRIIVADYFLWTRI
jgi:hypothetical protein